MKLLILAVCICAAHAAPPSWSTSLLGSSAHAAYKAPSAASFAAVAPPAAAVRSGHSSDVDAPILKSVSDVAVDGFNYAYETGNGISAEAGGHLTKVNDQEVITVKGGYNYVAPDGTPVHVTYVADENGYQPQSNLLPVAPPVPVAIARALEYIATHAKYVEPEYKRRV